MLGGALGAGGRHAVSIYTEQWITRNFPLGTLIVNCLGSFAIGLSFIFLNSLNHGGGSDPWRAFLVTGLLGGFTTFSAFSLQTLELLESGQWGRGFLNIFLSLALCLLACALGLGLARTLNSVTT